VSDSIKVGGRTVPVSNRDKVLFPDDGITKGELIDYYVAIAPAMIPHVRSRPVTMERYPDGIAGERIFQKNIPKYFPDWIPRASVPKKGGTVTHSLANDVATLAYLANQACIALHVWLSTIDHPDQPDEMIFDLDPAGDDFAEVRRTAIMLREVLVDAGLVPFVKTTGSKGLHVAVPIRPTEPFEVVYATAHSVAERLVAERPDSLTLEFMKAKREGRIFMDVNRNAYAQTAVAPYSVRPLRGAPVAVPLDWEEVHDRRLRPDGFSMHDALSRDDPWRGFRRAARSLSRARKSLEVVK
jgi:bifunctional non-homologous end joining protein LigD